MKYIFTLVIALFTGSFASASNEQEQKPENNIRNEVILNDIRHKPKPPKRCLLSPDFCADLSCLSRGYDVLFVSVREDVYYFAFMVD